MAKLPKEPITYGRCSACGKSNVPLVMFRGEAVCFDPCENIKRRNWKSRNKIRDSEKQKDLFRRLTNS